MRLKIETFFKVSVWDERFLLKDTKLDWTKAIMTNQGLDRVGDSFWISGIHVGRGVSGFTESSTGLEKSVAYKSELVRDDSDVTGDGERITWSREIECRFDKDQIGDANVTEVSMSWDEDDKTSTALLSYLNDSTINSDQKLVVECRVLVHERLDDIEVGEVDFGASKHKYTIRPCFYEKYPNSYIGISISQKAGKVYSGSIQSDPAKEPDGSIDTNLANFGTYTFDTRSKTFSNFFNLSSPNAVTRTATSHTFGVPSAFGIQFDPPIDKDFNREMTLNFKINWDRG